MNELKIVVSKSKANEVKCDLLVTFAVQDKKDKPVFDPIIDDIPSLADDCPEFSAKVEQTLLLYPPFSLEKKLTKIRRILVVGLGNIKSNESAEQLAEIFRTAGGQVAQLCKSSKVGSLAIHPPSTKGIDDDAFVQHLVEGLQLGLYQFLNYKKIEEDTYQGLEKTSILAVKRQQALRNSVELGLTSSNAGCVARNMANEPGNGWTAADFAKYSKKLGKMENVKCTVIDKDEMNKLGMGGILAVNQGSHEPPKLVIVDYCPKKYSDTLMLVGKGLTFDSGGISIKPAQGMMDMKYDMCGGAAVISAMEAIARERPKIRVVGVVPSTDNMNGGGAVKPGDIITHYGGTTSEIENTDAEGRLILADALAYGIEKYSPDYIIDLATLTGAVIIALGHHHSGIMSNSDQLVDRLIKAGNQAGEPLWRLPLGELYAKQIKSTVADIKNTGGRAAGTITAAEYLQKFVGKIPWAHLDIAGTAWNFTEKAYIPKGPSGIGARTLIELVRAW